MMKTPPMKSARRRIRHRLRLFLIAVSAASLAAAAAPDPKEVARLTEYAEAFARVAPRIVAEETLLQRSYGTPPHGHFAIGAGAVLRSRYALHEVVSEYSLGALNEDTSGALLEFRELVSKDGEAVQTPEEARKAIATGLTATDPQTRKKMLSVFTKLGLVDVATDFSQALMNFTRRAVGGLELEDAADAWVGVEAARLWKWRQRSGGGLEFRGRKTAVEPMSGSIWIRKSDGAPLRVQVEMRREEARHTLHDVASVEYVGSTVGSVVPVSVVHRHYVDDTMLTENLYLYKAFRIFATDTRIQFTGEPKKP